MHREQQQKKTKTQIFIAINHFNFLFKPKKSYCEKLDLNIWGGSVVMAGCGNFRSTGNSNQENSRKPLPAQKTLNPRKIHPEISERTHIGFCYNL